MVPLHPAHLPRAIKMANHESISRSNQNSPPRWRGWWWKEAKDEKKGIKDRRRGGKRKVAKRKKQQRDCFCLLLAAGEFSARIRFSGTTSALDRVRVFVTPIHSSPRISRRDPGDPCCAHFNPRHSLFPPLNRISEPYEFVRPLSLYLPGHRWYC